MLAVPVPFFDWAGLYAERGNEFGRIMHETASRGGFILQRDVDEFEQALAKFLGIKHVVAVSDATNAMLLGLRACKLEEGSEVILPSHGFVAAAQSIHFAGGVPIPVDLSETDWLIDPDAIRSAITPRTRAIMPVHVNGRVCEMDAIRQIAAEYGLRIFEDSAQAAGARYQGIPAGAFGAWGVFSFYPSKTLGCFGDAGALATNDDEVAANVRMQRNHGAGADKRIPLDIKVWGTNSRCDNIHAAILAYKLTYYQETIDRRREIARSYHDAFSQIEELRLPPPPSDEGDHYDIFQNYEIRAPRHRDALRAYLADRRVGTIVQWGGVGQHQFSGLGMGRHCPRTDAFFEDSLLIPMNHILTQDQVAHVIETVTAYFRG